jgi:hypothetical protein
VVAVNLPGGSEDRNVLTSSHCRRVRGPKRRVSGTIVFCGRNITLEQPKFTRAACKSFYHPGCAGVDFVEYAQRPEGHCSVDTVLCSTAAPPTALSVLFRPMCVLVRQVGVCGKFVVLDEFRFLSSLLP